MVLYGLADVIVVAIGGFLLLPLYTRTLTQAEFGTFVIVRANTEIFTYLLYFGLTSAVARVYFDYRERDEHTAYLSSVLAFFVLNLVVCGCALALWGSAPMKRSRNTPPTFIATPWKPVGSPNLKSCRISVQSGRRAVRFGR